MGSYSASIESFLLCGLCALRELCVNCFFASMPWFQMPSFFIQQFGCRATQADGAALERQLLDRGCTAASESASADVVVVNTCTVTASADAQARDAIRKLHAANPAARVIVTGCYAQRAPGELAALPRVSPGAPGFAPPPTSAHFPSLSRPFPPPPQPSQTVPFSPPPALEAAPMPLWRAPAKLLPGDFLKKDFLPTPPVLGGEGNHPRP